MTQEQKRIKLTESAGWEVIGLTLCNVKPDKNGDPEIEPIAPLPDYFNDLNAVQELEKVLTEDQYDEYRHHLGKAVGYLWRGIFSATATQRADAIGKTLNLW